MEESNAQLKDMETTWEQKLAEQRQKDEQEKKIFSLNNKRAPHLTNLNEDSQLSGKVYYSLAELHDEQVVVGRSNCDPKP